MPSVPTMPMELCTPDGRNALPQQPPRCKAISRHEAAAMIVQRWWRSRQDRRVYRLLVYAVRSTEQFLAMQVLRRVAPKEALILRDRAMHVRVRFRLDGTSFPPQIVFKVYCSGSLLYLSGKTQLSGKGVANDAASEAFDQMGARRAVETIIFDDAAVPKCRLDVVDLRDWRQWQSSIDETPCSYGGRNNRWRRITLDDVPRRYITYDILSFIERGVVSDRLR